MSGTDLVAYRRRKQDLLAGVRGTVLELGPGRGANFGLLPAGVDWIGLEPSARSVRALRRLGRGPVLQAPAEAIPLEDGRVDVVLATTVLCSVTDPVQVLAEVRRVLRPGGRFLFFEHVAAPPGTFSARLQRTIAPVTCRLDRGCRPDRATDAVIAAAGFVRVRLDRFRHPGPLGAFGPYVAGVAEV
jgi:SAM-dependent methyltransferase